MKLKIPVIAIALVVLAAVALAVSATPRQQVQISYAYLPVSNALPLYVAMERGYFSELGLNVTAVKIDAPSQEIDSVLQGKVHFAAAAAVGITAIANSKDPGKIKVFGTAGGTLEVPNEHIVVAKNSSINSIADLRGKRLAIIASSIQWQTIAREILNKSGLDMQKDLTIVELAVGMQAQALAAGQVDAVLGLEPIPTIIIQNGIGRILSNGPAENLIGNPFYTGVDLVNTKFMAEHPQEAQKVIAAIAKARDEIRKDPDSYRRYLMGYTPLTENLTRTIPMSLFKACSELDRRDLTSIGNLLDTFSKYGIVPGQLTFSDVLICKPEGS